MATAVRVKKSCYTLEEVVNIIENDSDEDIENVVIIPPINQGDVTDEEEEADGMPNDVAGELEIDVRENDTHNDIDKKQGDSVTIHKDIRWRRARHNFDNSLPARVPIQPLEESHPELCDRTPFELFQYFFTDDFVNNLVTESNRYAAQNNVHTNPITYVEMMRFVGIILLSGYHELPAQNHYWSTDEDLGVPIVSASMTRNRFTTIKRYLHLANNETAERQDRAAKVRPFFDSINKQLTQFGIFAVDLSVDEQMVPYFGKHGAKMFMHNKPVKFGYKFWVIASSNGYPFSLQMYLGKNEDRGNETLGTFVVNKLLTVVNNMGCHTVTFDNFFSSYDLFVHLAKQNLAATGTIRYNRLKGAPLSKPEEVRKLPRGAMEAASDGQVVCCSWHDNKPVYVASNFHRMTPIENKRRFSQKEKKHIQVECPAMIVQYNKNMGGVDSCDRFLSNYRPTIKGKKWWFCLFTHGVNVLTVAAWRLHVSLGGKLSELDFLRDIVRCLLKTEKPCRLINIQNPRSQLDDIRFDGENHELVKGLKEGRCKLQGCGRNTFYECKKCSQRLHMKCFASYHLKN